MKKVRIAIIGSHGLYASYGGWDQLVNNLAEHKNPDIQYLIYNSSDTPISLRGLTNVEVRQVGLKASGLQGIFYDFITLILCWWSVDVVLLLGTQGMPIVPILRAMKKTRVVSNVGGIEWERPQFGKYARIYLKQCFKMSFNHSDYVVIDNKHYERFVPNERRAKLAVLPYGGEIDSSLRKSDKLINKYPFLGHDYYLSVSRAISDNQIFELCQTFRELDEHLVVISNFGSSAYGKSILEEFEGTSNITLINGLYDKPELDLVRINCVAYIHTHTLCGTAPSLVEMIVAQRPIISIDVPQNRYTLKGGGHLFKTYSDLKMFIQGPVNLGALVPDMSVVEGYHWKKVVRDYEVILQGNALQS